VRSPTSTEEDNVTRKDQTWQTRWKRPPKGTTSKMWEGDGFRGCSQKTGSHPNGSEKGKGTGQNVEEDARRWVKGGQHRLSPEERTTTKGIKESKKARNIPHLPEGEIGGKEKRHGGARSVRQQTHLQVQASEGLHWIPHSSAKKSTKAGG